MLRAQGAEAPETPRSATILTHPESRPQGIASPSPKDSNTHSLGRLPHPHKLIIAGNHDLPWYRRPRYARLWLHHARYLQDSGAEVLGFKVWGSPWQPDFAQWAFYQERDSPKLAYIWEKIPDDTQILITHVPPAGIMDFMTEDGPSGCTQLLARISELRHLKLHIFGHVHGGYGRLERAGTIFVNAAICDDSYRPIRSPIEILL
ncbi:MAG: metallophosphoesterase [Candidatus Eremiobacteraeota bacterium]|nr:metallophosphoesterase [Candidatus Eremiobacteraeota bacterium]MCW5869591.1 metallophosphoesterase [Candidatus Eremiobacteraeota bacterium]